MSYNPSKLINLGQVKSALELINSLKLDKSFIDQIISGEVSSELATSDGEELCTSQSNEVLLAYRKLYDDNAISSDVLNANLNNLLITTRSETARSISAHNLSESSHPSSLAVSQ